MNSIFVRLNVIFFFFLTILFVAAMGCAFSTYFFTPSASVVISAPKLLHTQKLTRPYEKVEGLTLGFDLKANLRGVFNWNVKQVFVWLSAEYSTPQRTYNRVSIWDDVLKSEDDAEVDMSGAEAKYSVMDFNQKLRNQTVKLTLHWDVMPIIGLLQTGTAGSSESITYMLP